MNKSLLKISYIAFLLLIAPSTSNAQEQCPVWVSIYQMCLGSGPSDDECEQRANEECMNTWEYSRGNWSYRSGDSGSIVNDQQNQDARNNAKNGSGGNIVESNDSANGDITRQGASASGEQPITVTGSRSQRLTTTSEDLRDKLETTCKAKLKQTATCCTDPMSCLTGDGSKSSDGAMMALQIVAGSATSMASLTGSCGTLGTVSSAMAAINAGLAFKCSQKISQCNSACGQIAKQAQSESRACRSSGGCFAADYSRCNADNGLNPVQVNNCKADADKLALQQSKEEAKAYADIAQEADQCDNYGGQAVQQQSQAIASLYAAKVAGLCKKAANTDTANKSNNAFDVNCSDPTNAANPICQNQCNRANAASDPMCAQLLGLGTSGYGSGAGNGLVDPNALGANGSGSIDEFEDAQGMNDPNIMASANKANVSSGGGGGGVPSSASSGGGGDAGAAGGGEGGGLNTDIMGGASSRSGYTNPYVRSSVGGGGYSASPGRGVASEKGRPFNPRDFLPGGKMDPKRKLAGLAAATPEIGAVHGNIFTNITNRFLQVCLRDGLFDCESVRKNARPRN